MENGHDIALVPVSYMRAGTEEVMLDLGRALAAHGRRVAAVVPREPGLDGLASELADTGITVMRAGRYFGSRPPFMANVRELVQAFRELRPGTLHLHTPWVAMGGEAILAAFAAGVPLRVRTEQNPVMTPLSHQARLKLQALDRLTHGISFVSRGNLESHLANAGRPRGKCMVVTNSVRPAPAPWGEKAAIRAHLGLAQDVPIAVMAARLEPRKGLLDFVEAARAAVQLDARVQFAAFGDGELRAEAAARVVAAGLERRFHFLGYRSDVRALLPAFDIYVQPSHYEGLSVAMLEALAAGLPMVTTAVDGVAEVAPGPGDAIVVPVGDAPGLGRGIAQLAGDPGLRVRMSAATRSRVETAFTVEAMAGRYLRFYSAAAHRAIGHGRRVVEAA